MIQDGACPADDGRLTGWQKTTWPINMQIINRLSEDGRFFDPFIYRQFNPNFGQKCPDLGQKACGFENPFVHLY
jgi:hypothetical protein